MTIPTFTAAMALMLKYQRLRLTFEEAANELGYMVGTAYNLRSAGRFPVPVQKERGVLWADVRDVGEHLDKKRADALAEFEAEKEKRAA